MIRNVLSFGKHSTLQQSEKAHSLIDVSSIVACLKILKEWSINNFEIKQLKI